MDKPIKFTIDQIFIQDCWTKWKERHEKDYADPTEENRRRKFWLKKMVEQTKHNLQADLQLISYYVGLNQFAAMLPGESICCMESTIHECDEVDCTSECEINEDGTVTAILDPEFLQGIWKRWKRIHGKQYRDSTEECERYAMWAINLPNVIKHNVKNDVYLISWKRYLNAFSDLGPSEFPQDDEPSEGGSTQGEKECPEPLGGSSEDKILIPANEDLVKLGWSAWKQKFGKQYANENEENRRRKNWIKRMTELMQHELLNHSNLTRSKMEFTEFSDLSWGDLKAKLDSGWCPTGEELSDLELTGFGIPLFMDRSLDPSIYTSLSEAGTDMKVVKQANAIPL